MGYDTIGGEFGLAKRDLASPGTVKISLEMYYVYALLSKTNNDLYVGFTNDLRIRYKQHNNGEVQSTKANRPWILVYYEAYLNKKDATRREKQLKMHKAKSDLKEQIKFSLEV